MTQMVTHKMNAARFDYEYMGKSFEDLESIYGFPTPIIRREATHGQWIRKIEPQELPKTKDIKEFAKALEDVTRSKLNIIALFRQIEQQPLIAEIEKVFLAKALSLASALHEQDTRAPQQLLTLIKAIETLKERNPIDLADKVAAEIGKSGAQVVVNIQNNIQ